MPTLPVWLRWGGAVALVTGLLVAWRSFPTRQPQDWTAVHTFELDSDECDALREARATSNWVAPRSLAAPVSVAEVTRKFQLELALVCQANASAGETCSAQTLTPGEGRLTLPLYREPLPHTSRRTP